MFFSSMSSMLSEGIVLRKKETSTIHCVHKHHEGNSCVNNTESCVVTHCKYLDVWGQSVEKNTRKGGVRGN
jgi:hypothetical protein